MERGYVSGMHDHPFAQYLRIIGKGPSLSRSLTQTEARQAMDLVLSQGVTPEQLGAFLLLLRYRGETAEEIAGFVQAARDVVSVPVATPVSTQGIDGRPDLDWPSYADRHRQQPWFVLSALLLARNGVRVLMHGIAGEYEGYAPTRPVLQALDIPVSHTLRDATARMAGHGLAYVGLESFLPVLGRMFDLRPVLGVRTLVNTFARAINPLMAPHQVQGVVHPPYRLTHRDVALLLNQPASVVFKGGGGEAQRNPLKTCRSIRVCDGQAVEEDWPALLANTSRDGVPESLKPDRVRALWHGEIVEPVAEAAVIATTGIVLHVLGRAATMSEADAMAAEMWARRKE